MARAKKLKVYRTPAGFYDAYVAAPSQKAALEAWGSDRDLFARGIAELVTDPALTAAPLAAPGVVVRLSRGTTAEQIAAMPARGPRKETGNRQKRASRSGKASPPRPAPKPKPSSADLDAAERALETTKTRYDRQIKSLVEREMKLARERKDVEQQHRDDTREALQLVDRKREAYEIALSEWQGSRGRP